MLGSLSTVIALLAVKVAGTIYYAGVAESGGEFGVYSMNRQVWGDCC
jgi:endoglucanase